MASSGQMAADGWGDRLERLARIIPGVGAYQDREGLREADKRIRTYVADLLASVARDLEPMQRSFADGGRLDRLATLERLGGLLAMLGDRVRFARYGFSGVFAEQKIRAKELQDLHDFDLRLVQEIPGLRRHVQAVAQAADAEEFARLVRTAEESLRGLEGLLEERDRLARGL